MFKLIKCTYFNKFDLPRKHLYRSRQWGGNASPVAVVLVLFSDEQYYLHSYKNTRYQALPAGFVCVHLWIIWDLYVFYCITGLWNCAVKDNNGTIVNSYNLSVKANKFTQRVQFAPDQDNTLE